MLIFSSWNLLQIASWSYKEYKKFKKLLWKQRIVLFSKVKYHQAKRETDHLIVKLQLKRTPQTVIVAEDIDILVILTVLMKMNKEIYFLKWGKQYVSSVLYLSKVLKFCIQTVQNRYLFSHCFTGYNTQRQCFSIKKNFFLI